MLPLGGGETGSPPPKPLDHLFSSDENIGGGGIALQALLLALRVCTSTMPRRALQCVAVHIHRGTCRNRHVVLRQGRHAHTVHHDSCVKVSECKTSEQELLSLAPSSSEWTQNAKNINGMIFVQFQAKDRTVWTVTFQLLAFRSCCQDDRIHCCSLLSLRKCAVSVRDTCHWETYSILN